MQQQENKPLDRLLSVIVGVAVNKGIDLVESIFDKHRDEIADTAAAVHAGTLQISNIENLANFTKEGLIDLIGKVIEDINLNGIRASKGKTCAELNAGRCGVCVNEVFYPCA